MQAEISIDDSNQGNIWKMQPFRNHLGANKDVDLADAEGMQSFAIGILTRHGIGVHSPDDCFREQCGDVSFNLFRTETGIDQRILATFGAAFGNGSAMSAKVAAESGIGAMKGKSDAAIWAVARFATMTAEERSREAAPVEKEDGLFFS